MQLVNLVAATFGTCVEVFLCILITAIHAAVAVMVDRTIADIIGVHEVYDVGDGLWVVRGISIYFHIENMASSRELVIRAFYFCLMAWRAFVVHRHMVGIGIIYLVGNARDFTEALAVLGCEFARQPFGGGGKY